MHETTLNDGTDTLRHTIQPIISVTRYQWVQIREKCQIMSCQRGFGNTRSNKGSTIFVGPDLFWPRRMLTVYIG